MSDIFQTGYIFIFVIWLVAGIMVLANKDKKVSKFEFVLVWTALMSQLVIRLIK